MEEKVYECIIGFALPKWDSDNDEFSEDEMIAEEGSIWKENDSHIIGGEVSLANDNGEWIEIDKDTLNEYFKDITKSAS